MKQPGRYIAFDLGAESGRCVVGELHESCLRLTEVHRFRMPAEQLDGHYFWDAVAIYTHVLAGLERAVREFGPAFSGISLDTWGVDYVLLDAGHRLLGLPYHYRDKRTDDIVARAIEVRPAAELYRLTGNALMPYNTLFQLLAEKQQDSSWLPVARWALPLANYFLYLLCGEIKAEYTIASTWQLIDQRTRGWSDALLQAFLLPRHLFPEIVEPGTPLGTLQPELATRTGLAAETPVIATACHDTAAAVAAVPADGTDWAFLSSGTWSIVGIETAEPVVSTRAFTAGFTNEGSVGGRTRLLKNINGLWPVQECRQAWSRAGQDYSYDQLVALARKAGPARGWVDLSRPALLKPGDMPAKIQAFLAQYGQPVSDTPGRIVRCILESLVFVYRRTVAELRAVTGRNISRIHAVGGGVQNELLTQLAADACECEIIAGPVEGTVAGNIGVQAMAQGDIRDLPHLREVMRNSFPLKKYRPADARYWRENEPKFRALCGEHG